MRNSNGKGSALANLPEVTELCSLALYSDFVVKDEGRKETPVSPILVAPPEQAKTAVLDQFDPTDGLLYIDNVTAWGIEHKYLEHLKTGRIRRIVIPDFVDPTNRKKTTVDTTITFFNKYISWEGIKEIQTYAMDLSLETPIKGAIMTTMATADFKRMVKGLAAVGFLSRLIVIGYQYSKEDLDLLLDDIVFKRARWDKINLPFPDTPQEISLAPELAIKMKPLAKSLGERVGGGGIRAILQLEMLVKSRALSEGRDTVIEDDIRRVMYLAQRYVNNVVLDAETRRSIKLAEDKLVREDN